MGYWTLYAYLIWQQSLLLYKSGLSSFFFRNTIIGEEIRPDDSSRETCPTVFLYWYEFSTVAMEMQFHESLYFIIACSYVWSYVRHTARDKL